MSWICNYFHKLLGWAVWTLYDVLIDLREETAEKCRSEWYHSFFSLRWTSSQNSISEWAITSQIRGLSAYSISEAGIRRKHWLSSWTMLCSSGIRTPTLLSTILCFSVFPLWHTAGRDFTNDQYAEIRCCWITRAVPDSVQGLTESIMHPACYPALYACAFYSSEFCQ